MSIYKLLLFPHVQFVRGAGPADRRQARLKGFADDARIIVRERRPSRSASRYPPGGDPVR
jgi:hypothetical protein